MFTLDELRFSGHHDPIAALVLCGAHRADRVMIAGRWTLEGGIPPGIDLDVLRDEHSRLAKTLIAACQERLESKRLWDIVLLLGRAQPYSKVAMNARALAMAASCSSAWSPG